MFKSRFDDLPPSPFRRLAALLDGTPPQRDPVIDLSIGEPRHALPEFVGDILARSLADFSRYPPAHGTEDLRTAIADWVSRRYGVTGLVDPALNIIPVSGTREALYNIAPVIIPENAHPQPAVLIPNPFYQTYATAAVSAGAEPVLLAATRETGHLPDLDSLSPDLLARTAAFYLCTPANPQGVAASMEYLKKAIGLAREHGFTLLVDECYSELYSETPPPGAVQAAAELGEGLSNIVIFNSLSKRSNLAGLRSGFCAGDASIMASFLKFRNIAAPQMPLPVQAVSAAAWADEQHVDASRDLYCQKYAMAADIVRDLSNDPAPTSGMFLWLDIGDRDAEQTALNLWSISGVKVIPGTYLALDMPDGSNPGTGYIRIALVHDLSTTRDALTRIAATIQ